MRPGPVYFPLSHASSNADPLEAPTGAKAALIVVEGEPCHVTFDGSVPGSGNGLPFDPANMPVGVPIRGGEIRFAPDTGSSVLHVAWLG